MASVQMCGSEHSLDTTSYKLTSAITINSQFLHYQSRISEYLFYVNLQTFSCTWYSSELNDEVKPIELQ